MPDQSDRLPIAATGPDARPANGDALARPAGDRPLLLDAAALGHELGLSLRTVRRLDQRGELPQPVTIGRAVRWRASEIRDWCNAGCPARSR